MILTGDIHLELTSEDIVREVFRQIRALAVQRREDHLVLLGDLFDVRHVVPIRLLTAFRDCLYSLSPQIQTIDIIDGNHDQWCLEGRNVLEVFENGVVDFLASGVPQIALHTYGARDDGLNIRFLPWTADPTLIRASIDRGGMDKDRFLFAHLAVQGAFMNNLRKDEDGFSLEELQAAGYEHVFMGHYHRHHDVAPGITYVGSPYQVTYAEAGQPKGVVVLDAKTGKYDFVELNAGPKHHKVVVDADHPDLIPLPEAAKGDKVWIQVRGQMGEVIQQQIAEKLAKAGVDIARFDIDVRPEEVAPRLELGPEEPLRKVAVDYVQAQDVDPAYRVLLLEAFNSVVPQ